MAITISVSPGQSQKRPLVERCRLLGRGLDEVDGRHLLRRRVVAGFCKHVPVRFEQRDVAERRCEWHPYYAGPAPDVEKVTLPSSLNSCASTSPSWAE